MRGLMAEHGMKPDDFLDFVHQIDHSPLEPNPALGAALEQLHGRKLILTNGTRKHADAVMQRLAIHSHFEDVYDIIAAELDPKPLPQTYDRFLARHGVDPKKAAMFEDLARNLSVPHALGMTTVLVIPPSARARSFARAGSSKAATPPHVDHVTDNLVGFLQGIVPAALAIRLTRRRFALDIDGVPSPFRSPAVDPAAISREIRRGLPHVCRSRQDHRRRFRAAQ